MTHAIATILFLCCLRSAHAQCAALPAPPNGGSIRSVTGSRESDLIVAQIAVDADVELFEFYGSVAAVEQAIADIVSAVNQQYEAECGIRYEVVSMTVRTEEPDPYTSTDAVTLLTEFKAQWDSNPTERHAAWLLTGKVLNPELGGILGVAWIGGMCSEYGYCISKAHPEAWFGQVTDIASHEFGHLWNAQHCVCNWPPHTMNAAITGANEHHPEFTIPGIIEFRDSLACFQPCVGDANNDGVVDVNDLLLIITEWNGVNDLLAVINGWGICP